MDGGGRIGDRVARASVLMRGSQKHDVFYQLECDQDMIKDIILCRAVRAK
jgi:hypothetical protein